MSVNPQTIPFIGTRLTRHNGECTIVSSQNEKYRKLIPFIEEGADDGEEGFHIVRKAEHSPQARM